MQPTHSCQFIFEFLCSSDLFLVFEDLNAMPEDSFVLELRYACPEMVELHWCVDDLLLVHVFWIVLIACGPVALCVLVEIAAPAQSAKTERGFDGGKGASEWICHEVTNVGVVI